MIMFPSYSPLFTMGLLAEHSPIAPTASPSTPRTASDDASAIYFTLQTSKRDSIELRSFLYLDLADGSLRSPSHKRKCSVLSKSTSWTCFADAKSMYDFAQTEKPMITPTPATRRRTSRESLRSIPSPKPAPSATLPELPIYSLSPPSSPLSSLPSKKRPTSTVVGPLLHPNPRTHRPASLRSVSISSHDRRKSRMDALACLEGRAPNRLPRSSARRNNFMSFSDDEDEKSLARKSSLPKEPSMPTVHADDLGGFADVEDEVDVNTPNVKPSQPARPIRRRRGTIESWFPLKSFIDLKDDDLSSWNWRSFIEIGGVA